VGVQNVPSSAWAKTYATSQQTLRLPFCWERGFLPTRCEVHSVPPVPLRCPLVGGSGRYLLVVVAVHRHLDDPGRGDSSDAQWRVGVLSLLSRPHVTGETSLRKTNGVPPFVSSFTVLVALLSTFRLSQLFTAHRRALDRTQRSETYFYSVCTCLLVMRVKRCV
jgi:hypothetical protein